MRVLILAAAATLVITGTAMANESVQRHQHYRNANASIADSLAPSVLLPPIPVLTTCT